MVPRARVPACCMTSGEIARLVCVDLKTIHNWVRHGHLRGRRTKGRHLRFHRTEVVRFMRRFGYAVPESLGAVVPRVLLVGLPAVSTVGRALHEYVDVERHDGLFDAALVVAAGDYEVLALDADLFGIGHVIDLVTALRRRPVTQGVAIIALSGVAEHRAQFLEAGGDMAIASPAELGAAVRWVTGAAVLQAPAPMANAAGA